MLRVRKELCLGCGICSATCNRHAISMSLGYAEIDPHKCNSCGACVQVCPQGVIIECTPLSIEKLRPMITSLSFQTEDIIQRIQALKR